MNYVAVAIVPAVDKCFQVLCLEVGKWRIKYDGFPEKSHWRRKTLLNMDGTFPGAGVLN